MLISMYLAPYTQPTRGRYQRVLLDWLWWCARAGLHIVEARQLHIEQWARVLRAEGAAKSTIASKLVPVCGFYRHAFQQGWTERDESAYVRRPSRPRRSEQKWLSREQAVEVLALSREMGPPADLLVHLLLLNGLRLGDVTAANVEHLGAQEAMATLRLPTRKGGVLDVVTLPASTVEILPAHVGSRERGPLLRSSGGRRMTPSIIYGVLDQLSRVMEIGYNIRPHMLRATFVTLSLDAGVPARDVMASTGHAHVAMVAYYDRAHASIRRNASHRLSDWLEPK